MFVYTRLRHLVPNQPPRLRIVADFPLHLPLLIRPSAERIQEGRDAGFLLEPLHGPGHAEQGLQGGATILR